MDKENGFYAASMPGPNGHLSKIRLIEELTRMKGSAVSGTIGYSSENGLFVLLDDQNRTMYVRVNGELTCHNNPFDEECEPCFYDGEWFNEVEKYREIIESNMKTIQEKHIMALVSESFKRPSAVI